MKRLANKYNLQLHSANSMFGPHTFYTRIPCQRSLSERGTASALLQTTGKNTCHIYSSQKRWKVWAPCRYEIVPILLLQPESGWIMRNKDVSDVRLAQKHKQITGRHPELLLISVSIKNSWWKQNEGKYEAVRNIKACGPTVHTHATHKSFGTTGS